MNSAEVIKLNDQAIESWNQHDTTKFISYCDDAIEITELGVTDKLKGKPGAREFLDNWSRAFPDFKIKVVNKVATENSYAAELEFTGTNTGPMKMSDGSELPATNKRVSNLKGSYFAQIRNGRFLKINSYPDLATLFTELGVIHELHA
jgi:steroid delta-isomerase-like uncharacterized protein